MIKYFAGLLLVLICVSTHAQTATDSVKAAVNNLFKGMMDADAAGIRAAFADSALLQSVVVGNDGKVSIRNEAITEFASSISRLKKGEADERISFETIKIDGPLASVWTPYSFYFRGQFSHCGVDSYQLVRINGNWKIQYLVDTRRKQPCTP